MAMDLRIVLLGAPGAGKGTQAQRIAEAKGLPHISTGDIFRAHLRDGTDLGKQVQAFMAEGKLVPDELTCDIVAQRLGETDCSHGYILDGFPRSVPQAENLERLLTAQGDRIDIAVSIDVDDDAIVERLSARRSCPKCGAIYNLRFSPPKQDNVCDRPECGGAELVQREDDQEDTIRERLRVYHETTEPIVAFYDERGLLSTVAATPLSPEEVFKEIESILARTVGA